MEEGLSSLPLPLSSSTPSGRHLVSFTRHGPPHLSTPTSPPPGPAPRRGPARPRRRPRRRPHCGCGWWRRQGRGRCCRCYCCRCRRRAPRRRGGGGRRRRRGGGVSGSGGGGCWRAGPGWGCWRMPGETITDGLRAVTAKLRPSRGVVTARPRRTGKARGHGPAARDARPEQAAPCGGRAWPAADPGRGALEALANADSASSIRGHFEDRDAWGERVASGGAPSGPACGTAWAAAADSVVRPLSARLMWQCGWREGGRALRRYSAYDSADG